MSQICPIDNGYVIIEGIYMQAIDSIFYVAVLIMSVVVHEFAHGYTAYRFGDDTARLQGRLTLNPLKHLDLFGSIILPFLLIVSHAGFVLGWAKPVPYNPNNLRNGRKGEMLVAISGILANIFIALLFGLLMRFSIHFNLIPFGTVPLHPFYKILTSIVLLNIVLAVFNLVPIPPLDGSKVLFRLLSYKFRVVENFLEKWGMFVLILFIVYFWQYFSPLIFWIFTFISGVR